MNEKYNRMECNRCGRVFDFGDSIKIDKVVGGIRINERRCPYCESNFHALEVPEYFDKFLYCDYDDRYYSYPDNNNKG